MKITITEALVKLKNLDNKIEDAQNRVFVGHVQNGRKLPSRYNSEEEFVNAIQASIDTPLGLIKARNNIKAKIALANANTIVKIGSKEMTVVEAIELKNSIKNRVSLLNKLKTQKDMLDDIVNKANSDLAQQADKFVIAMYGNNNTANVAERNASRESFIQNNSVKLLTSPKVSSTIESLEREIDEFLTNVDVALSVVNATTYIEVD